MGRIREGTEVITMERNRRRQVLIDIQQDASWDARKWDGVPFSGQAVATMHGETLAMIAVLAKIVESILEDLE